MQGKLPWQGLQGKDKKDKYDKIFTKKMSSSINELCKGLPNDFLTFISYCRSLEFEDEPNNSILKKEFKEYFITKGMNINFEFDWIINEKKRKEPQRTISVNVITKADK